MTILGNGILTYRGPTNVVRRNLFIFFDFFYIFLKGKLSLQSNLIIMSRKDWDGSAIARNVKAAEGTEHQVALRINEELKSRNSGINERIFVYDRNTRKEKKKGFDLDVMLQATNGKITKIGNIEVEVGLYQHDWDNNIFLLEPIYEHVPGRKKPKHLKKIVDGKQIKTWWRGLSILFRKIMRADQSDIFIKTSPTYKSMFVLDWTWFGQMIHENRVVWDKNAFLRGVKTDNCGYCIPWELAKTMSASDAGGVFAMDDWGKLTEMIWKLALKYKKDSVSSTHGNQEANKKAQSQEDQETEGFRKEEAP